MIEKLYMRNCECCCWGWRLHGIRKLKIATDSTVALKLCLEEINVVHSCYGLVFRVKSMLRCNWEIRLMHLGERGIAVWIA